MADPKSKEEQARKAQALAEKCFLAGNFFGAKQWMVSAVRLAPDLPGNAQFVAAYDVHAAAARRPLNWYAVLDLPHPSRPGAVLTHDAIKKQHRKLCLLVHPDKNTSAAADGAFKLVQAAWDALSARHLPGMTAAAAVAKQPTPPTRRQAAPPRPSDPPPQPRPRPQVVQMTRTRRAAPPPTTSTSYSSAATAPQPQKGRRASPPRPSRRSPSPPAGKCPVCGATKTNGKRSFRCMSCQWSPMDERPDDEYDDDFFEYDY